MSKKDKLESIISGLGRKLKNDKSTPSEIVEPIIRNEQNRSIVGENKGSIPPMARKLLEEEPSTSFKNMYRAGRKTTFGKIMMEAARRDADIPFEKESLNEEDWWNSSSPKEIKQMKTTSIQALNNTETSDEEEEDEPPKRQRTSRNPQPRKVQKKENNYVMQPGEEEEYHKKTKEATKKSIQNRKKKYRWRDEDENEWILDERHEVSRTKSMNRLENRYRKIQEQLFQRELSDHDEDFIELDDYDIDEGEDETKSYKIVPIDYTSECNRIQEMEKEYSIENQTKQNDMLIMEQLSNFYKEIKQYLIGLSGILESAPSIFPVDNFDFTSCIYKNPRMAAFVIVRALLTNGKIPYWYPSVLALTHENFLSFIKHQLPPHSLIIFVGNGDEVLPQSTRFGFQGKIDNSCYKLFRRIMRIKKCFTIGLYRPYKSNIESEANLSKTRALSNPFQPTRYFPYLVSEEWVKTLYSWKVSFTVHNWTEDNIKTSTTAIVENFEGNIQLNWITHPLWIDQSKNQAIEPIRRILVCIKGYPVCAAKGIGISIEELIESASGNGTLQLEGGPALEFENSISLPWPNFPPRLTTVPKSLATLFQTTAETN